MADDHAYYCYCSKEDLEAERQALLSQGMVPKYGGRCRQLASGKGPAGQSPQLIRFKVPAQKVSFKDLIRGEITFDTEALGDLAIAKNLKTPLYNFAVVVDDQEMKITHVIRGEDHIPNTPKQLLLMEALGFHRPHYAHLPLILDPDRSKMSKRYSAAAIHEYRQQGYLPEAIINFMALLGWHPTTNQELFSLDQLAQEFDLARVQKAGAIFDLEKLNWLNAQYLRNLPDETLAAKLGIDPTPHHLQIIRLSKARMKKLNDFHNTAQFFFQLPDYPAELLCWKGQTKSEAAAKLAQVEAILDDPKAIMALAQKEGRGEVLWPLRAALSGLKESPGPLEILAALEKNEARRRLTVAIEKLKSN